jgi:hypothetical protein
MIKARLAHLYFGHMMLKEDQREREEAFAFTTVLLMM